MATKLFVGNLSFRTTSDELRDLFAQAGTVESASVIEDRETGRSRGFGFVEMATQEDANAAVEQFNGKDFGGRNLTVNEARPREDRGGGGGGGRGYGAIAAVAVAAIVVTTAAGAMVVVADATATTTMATVADANRAGNRHQQTQENGGGNRLFAPPFYISCCCFVLIRG
jgi:RNA recognition motif-containing protein